ncbi:MAG TPA: amidase [Ramlibacter sp.]|nr:amidase [Ramlibacter sp.]
MNPICRQGAGELARRIANRELSSVEVVEAHLERIREVNPGVNAIVRVLGDDALTAARAADAAVGAGAALGPLHGVPFTIKENIDVAGLPTTCGVPALANTIASQDAPVVERMKAAGAIPIARTNLPDMGLRMATESTLHGVTRNPWRGDRTAGGSSGGEAVAIACGMSPIGLGNDLGGSLRNPANACGIASIRPSAGRVPHAQQIPASTEMLAMQWMMVQGPMARTVADVRLTLGVLAGAHPRDPWSVTAPLQAVEHGGPLRVAVMAHPPGGDCDPKISAIVRKAADVLANAGYDVVEATPPGYEETLKLWERLLATDMTVMAEGMASLGEMVNSVVQALLRNGNPCQSPAEFSRLAARRDAIARKWSAFMESHPLLLTPVWTQLPFEHGWDVTKGSNILEVARPVLPANFLGLPSACVPAGFDEASGLPVGVLVTGWRMNDGLCLDAAEHVQAHCGFETPLDPR